MKAYKITVNTPIEACDHIRKKMGDAGAGKVGNYSHCSFSIKGFGRSHASSSTKPFIGEVGRLNTVEEEQIQTFCTSNKLESVIKAIKDNHPYEEPAISVWEIEIY